MPIEFRVERVLYKNTYDVIIADVKGKDINIAAPPTFQKYDPQSAITEPTLSLSPEALQSLLDEIWKTGLRPTHHVDEKSALKATETHLRDMRRIVFDLLKAEHGDKIGSIDQTLFNFAEEKNERK